MTLAEKLIEKGIERGIERGIEKGIKEGEVKTLKENITNLLIIKFGAIPEEIKNKIAELDVTTLKIMLTEIFRYEKIDNVRKYLN